MVLVGTLVAVLLAMSGAGRGWRVFACLFWVIGGVAMGAAREGMCVLLFGVGGRQVRPWEVEVERGDVEGGSGNLSGGKGMGKGEKDWVSVTTSGVSVTSSCEAGSWAERYEKRPWLRKVLDRRVGVVDAAVREVQETLVLRALVLGVLGSAVATGVFVALPVGNLF